MRIALFLSAALILSLAGPAEASDPTGIYAIVDTVKLIPSAEEPTQILIVGAFSLATGRRSQMAPEWGTLYFSLPAGKEKEARQEWADLADIAGKRGVYGFGARRRLEGAKLYTGAERPKAPTPYPMGWGIHPVRNAKWGAPGLLRTLPRPVAPARPGNEMKVVESGMQEIRFTAANALAPNDGTRYLFEVETRRAGLVASPAIEPGERETEWKTWLYLQPGEVVKWSVRIVREDHDRFAVARSHFKVKAGEE